jgi:hypothetical protein
VHNLNSGNINPKNTVIYSANSTKNKHGNNKIDSTYVFSENINHKNYNNPKTLVNLTYSKVNVNNSNNTNVNYNNLCAFKDANLKINSETENNKELNNKIKFLADKIKVKKNFGVC